MSKHINHHRLSMVFEEEIIDKTLNLLRPEYGKFLAISSEEGDENLFINGLK